MIIAKNRKVKQKNSAVFCEIYLRNSAVITFLCHLANSMDYKKMWVHGN